MRCPPTHVWGTMPLTLREAAIATGRNRTTLLRAIKAGTLSAIRDPATDAWVIEPAELHRVYPPVARTSTDDSNAASRTPDSRDAEIDRLRVRLDAAEIAARVRDETIADLRGRLDAETAERRQATERLHALLTDQRAPVRRTWRWWRR